MKHRKGGEQPAQTEEEEDKAEVVPKDAKKEKKKEKKEIQGLGSHQVNLQLPIYGLAVRHVDFEEVEANEKGKSKDGKKETKSAALPLCVIVGGGGGPGNTGIENKVALFEFKVHLPSPRSWHNCLKVLLGRHCRMVAFTCTLWRTWESAPS